MVSFKKALKDASKNSEEKERGKETEKDNIIHWKKYVIPPSPSTMDERYTDVTMKRKKYDIKCPESPVVASELQKYLTVKHH